MDLVKGQPRLVPANDLEEMQGRLEPFNLSTMVLFSKPVSLFSLSCRHYVSTSTEQLYLKSFFGYLERHVYTQIFLLSPTPGYYLITVLLPRQPYESRMICFYLVLRILVRRMRPIWERQGRASHIGIE